MEYFNFIKRDDYDSNYSGEQRLCLAIIVQAIKDIHYTDRLRKNLGGKLPKQSKNDAIRWILSDDTSPFTFLWCLEHALPDLYDYLNISKLRQIVINEPHLCNFVTLYHSYHLSKKPSTPHKEN